ncbi:cell division protein FtsQ/DivIB [Limnohabitans lacus]|jgi:cell division protein FtsQ|uniref:Cell division protein FtsQ n=1 Tax=Limnohabitans lacus TaxID=3045173 RepID=A0ABT6X7E9_9BURK|nr:cell division protein FtsQ/DivIB [Limnohabitans sp. HM2-2]MDI9233986.1 cell division protein FtsQ/DivIB [Limnohabitans sp. HM2-2]
MKKPMPMPMDIRLMNFTANLLVVGVVLLGLGAWAWWLLRHPVFAIQSVSVQGEVNRNNAVTFKANVMPQLNGNFFTLDLEVARRAFEAVPWVRSAVVHRDFPNRLRAVLQEQHPQALWGEEGANTMVNEQGQVFEADLDDVDVESLPRMKGPAGMSIQVVNMYHYLRPIYKAVGMDIDQLELTPRGSWRVMTATGAVMELGRGTEAEIGEHLQVFFKTLSQVTARYGRTPNALAGADLRHKDGYALRLRGVSTVEDKKKP